MVITEAGFGAHEDLGADGQIHDQYRIDYLRDYIYNVGLAIADGVEVFGFNPWSFTDLLSTGNGMAKQFSSIAQSCLTLCNPMNCSTPGLPVHHQLPEFIQTHVHRVSDAIQPSHPLSSPSSPAPNLSQHQSLFQ